VVGNITNAINGFPWPSCGLGRRCVVASPAIGCEAVSFSLQQSAAGLLAAAWPGLVSFLFVHNLTPPAFF